MKSRFILLTLALVLFHISGFSQASCVPDTSIKEGGLYPNDSLLPCVERFIYYEQVVQFKNFDTIDGALVGVPGLFPVVSTEIKTLSHPPAGITLECGAPNCLYAGNANGCILATGTTTAPAGEYYLGITATVTVSSPFGSIPFDADSQTLADAGLTYKLTVIDNGASCPNTVCTSQDILLSMGWNMISSYIAPDDPVILNVYSDILSDVIIIKNGIGAATIPSLGINAIGNWNIEEGYKVKMANAATLNIGCEQVDPLNQLISVPAGWSIIPYLRTSPLDITTALNSINANVLLAKNITGTRTFLLLG